MSLETHFHIDGLHSLSGGPAGDGVYLGALEASHIPDIFLSRVEVAGAFSRVWHENMGGLSGDVTATLAAVTGSVAWPDSAAGDVIELGELQTGEHKIAGVVMRLASAGAMTGASGWKMRYPGSLGLVDVALNAETTTAVSTLTSGNAGDLIEIYFSTPFDPADVRSESWGGVDDYSRRLLLSVEGITAVATAPQIDRIWPIYDKDETLVYTDYTGVLQPLTGVPDYAAWPTQIVARSGDVTLIGCHEWPIDNTFIVDQSSGTSGTAEYVYWSTTGLKPFPAGYVNDASDFGRAAPGTYTARVAKPADAARVWVLTYTHDGHNETIVQAAEPALPGGVQVRKEQVYLWGRRYTQDSPGLVTPFHVQVGCRELNPATMTTTASLQGAGSLSNISISAAEATNAPGSSAWFCANSATGNGAYLSDTLTLTKTDITESLTFARSAGDGLVFIKLRDKVMPNAEARDGAIYVTGA